MAAHASITLRFIWQISDKRRDFCEPVNNFENNKQWFNSEKEVEKMETCDKNWEGEILKIFDGFFALSVY